MGNAVVNVLEALERYVGPYVPVILDRVFPSETSEKQEKQEEEIDWKALTGQLNDLLVEMKKSTELLAQLRELPEYQNVIPLHPVAEA
jgi:hypothetical protein